MTQTIKTLLTAAVTMTSLASCAKNDNAIHSKNTYVLVHGAWQAPYVWNAVRADLEAAGNKVVVVELPGHGGDRTPAHTLSLETYRDKVISAIDSINEKVILVGHSMGGMVVTAVAQRVPERIRTLVYIGAFVPASDQPLGELAASDPSSQLGRSLIESADHLLLDVKSEDLAQLFIPDGSAVDKQLVLDNYRAEPAIPFGGKITLTPDKFGSVDKVYIKTLQDIVISPGLQDKMIASARIQEVYSVNTSHSPFLSQPKAVSGLLLQLAK